MPTGHSVKALLTYFHTVPEAFCFVFPFWVNEWINEQMNGPRGSVVLYASWLFNTHTHVLRPILGVHVCRCIWYDRKQLKQTIPEREGLSTPISVTNKQRGSGIFPLRVGPHWQWRRKVNFSTTCKAQERGRGGRKKKEDQTEQCDLWFFFFSLQHSRRSSLLSLPHPRQESAEISLPLTLKIQAIIFTNEQNLGILSRLICIFSGDCKLTGRTSV